MRRCEREKTESTKQSFANIELITSPNSIFTPEGHLLSTTSLLQVQRECVHEWFLLHPFLLLRNSDFFLSHLDRNSTSSLLTLQHSTSTPRLLRAHVASYPSKPQSPSKPPIFEPLQEPTMTSTVQGMWNKLSGSDTAMVVDNMTDQVRLLLECKS